MWVRSIALNLFALATLAVGADAQRCVSAVVFDQPPKLSASRSNLLKKAEAGNPDAQFHTHEDSESRTMTGSDEMESSCCQRVMLRQKAMWAPCTPMAKVYPTTTLRPSGGTQGLPPEATPPAESNLGFMYSAGRGVSPDDKQAMTWYARAAAHGYVPGQVNLILAYFQRSDARDLAEAVKWFRKAAAQGAPLAERELAFAYEHGLGVPQDIGMAIEWYGKAAAHGLSNTEDDLRRLLENNHSR
jgi:TPR repeat protein